MQKNKPLKIEIGTKFGKWTVLKDLGIEREKSGTFHYLLCKCECGKILKIYLGNLRGGKTKNCRKCQNSKHGDGASHSPELIIWYGIQNRCKNILNPSYKYYGGRGIKVCKRWINSFQNFLKDMGKRPTGKRYTIERINNNGDYKPSNCKWATYKEQGKNKRYNPKRIFDDLNDRTDISRQRKTQIRNKRKGKCIICGKPQVKNHLDKYTSYCEYHNNYQKSYSRKRYKENRKVERTYKSKYSSL